MTTQEELQKLEERFAGKEELLKRLLQAHRLGRVGVDQTHIYSGLLICATAAKKHLVLAFAQRDPSYLCWAMRNLLELGIWAEFCVAPRNAEQFHLDGVRDLSGAMVAFDKLAEMASETERAIIDDSTAQTAELSIQRGVAPDDTKYIPVGDAAARIGKGVWFTNTNRVLSKLVHPTAYVVATAMAAGLPNPTRCDAFFLAGCSHAEIVYSAIERFVKSVEQDSNAAAMN